MPQNRRVVSRRKPVIHQLRPRSQSPERRSAHFLPGLREIGILNDAIARSHIVEQVIAERMKLLAPQSRGNRVLAAEESRSGRSSRECLNVTRRAAYLTKYLRARLRGRCYRQHGIARRN